MPGHLIITVHGISTFGKWQERLEALIISEDPNIRVQNYKYGNLSVVAFLVPFLRWLVTRRFRRDVLATIAKQNWDRIDIVAHSFGTHLVGWGLFGMIPAHRPRIHTIILAGSVLKSRFRWGELVGTSVVRLVNDCGCEDNVLLLNQVFVLLTGMAGRVGFHGLTGDNFRNRYFVFGHSGYFESAVVSDDTFMKGKWLPLLTTDGRIEPYQDPRPTSSVRMLLNTIINYAEPIKLTVWSLVLGIPLFYLFTLYVNEKHARALADQQARTALSRQLAAQAETLFNDQYDLGLLLAMQAGTIANTVEAKSSLFDGLLQNPALLSFLYYPEHPPGHKDIPVNGIPLRLSFTREGGISALKDDGQIIKWNLQFESPTLLSFDRGVYLDKPLSCLPRCQFTIADMTDDGRFLTIAEQYSDPKDDFLSRLEVTFWDLATHTLIRKALFRLPGSVHQIALSDDGRFIAFGGDGIIDVWNVDQTKLIFRKCCDRESSTSQMKFASDGTMLAIHSRHGVNLIDTRTGRMIRDVLRGGHEGDDTAMALSQDGITLAIGGYDGNIVLWDLVSRKIIGSMNRGHTKPITALKFSPDGKLLVSGSYDGSIFTYDVRALSQLGPPYQFQRDPVRLLVFRPDGKMFASMGDEHIIRVWKSTIEKHFVKPVAGIINPDEEQDLEFLRGRDIVWTIQDRLSTAFSEKGIWSIASNPANQIAAAVTSTGEVVLFNFESGQQEFKLMIAGQKPKLESLPQVLMSENGSVVAVITREEVRFFGVELRREVGTPLHLPSAISSNRAWLSPNGEMFATVSGKRIVLREVKTGITKQALLPVNEESDDSSEQSESASEDINVAIFDEDRKRLVGLNQDGKLIVWQVPSLTLVRSVQIQTEEKTRSATTNSQISLSYSPDGRTLSTALADADGGRGLARLWDADFIKPIGDPLHLPAIQPTYPIVFSPNGDLVVSGTSNNSIIVWRRNDLKPLWYLTGHRGNVNEGMLDMRSDGIAHLAFTSDGKTMISVGRDGSRILWDMTTGERLNHIPLKDGWDFAARGQFLVGGNSYLRNDEGSWKAVACSIINRNLTQTEWDQYVGDRPYQPQC